MKNIYKTVKKVLLGIALTSTTMANAQSYDELVGWVGTGNDSTIAVVDFLEYGESAFAWGVRFDDSISGNEILDLIVDAENAFEVNKGQFLSSIAYNEFNSSKNGHYWGTWTKPNNSWEMNSGISDKVINNEYFGFTLTDFNPALEPYTEIPNISFKGVDFWVGKGKDSAIAVIDFLEPDTRFVWGVRFDDSITGNKILDLISWNDKDFFVDKGSFLNGIDYKDNKSNKENTWWGTWSKKDGEWYANKGITDKVGNNNAFGFTYTDFNPAIAPGSNPIPAIKTYFTLNDSMSLSSINEPYYPSNVVELVRGYKDITVTDSGFVTHGEEADALYVNGNVVSLGDGGSITLGLPLGDVITNEAGPDFVVFENAFGPTFLELAFVEVSSDGENFVRFPSISITQTDEQIGGFGEVDAKNIHNLAGKYEKGIGTSFDLEDLKDNNDVDVNAINHIRIVDVLGSIDPQYGSKDSKGNLINEPFTTPFTSGGFDLDGVAIINYSTTIGLDEVEESNNVSVFPTQTSGIVSIETSEEILEVSINNSGNGISEVVTINNNSVNLSGKTNGLYILKVKTNEGTYSQKVVKY